MSRLQELCPIPLKLAWHENRTTYFSARKERGCLQLRLHRLFENAPTPVLEAVIKMALKKDPAARAIVRKMALLYFSSHRAPSLPLSAFGAVYDLNAIAQRIKEIYFDASFEAAIGWADSVHRGQFKSMTFGTYDRHRNQIRINPLLDDPQVPLSFIEFIVYHEMLHAVCKPSIDAAGRCRVHTAEFREKEQRFAQFKEAKEWEKTSLQFFKKKRRRDGRT